MVTTTEPQRMEDLQILLIKKNLTQRELSRCTDIPEVRLSDLINGRKVPKKGEISRIAAFLEVKPKQVYTGVMDSDF